MNALLTRTAGQIATTAVLTVTAGLGLTALTPVVPALAATHHAPKVTSTNLLRAHSFTAHGFAKADVLRAWEGDGPVETTECGGYTAREAPGYRNSRARMYFGRQTQAEELVVQFRTTRVAKAYVKDYREAMEGCEKFVGSHVWNSSPTQSIDVDGASTALWWTVTEKYYYAKNHRSISVVRTGKRVAVLELESPTSKPSHTTNIPALMQDAAAQLHR